MEQKMAGFKGKVSITKRNRLDGMVSESEDGNLVLTTTNSNK